VFPAPRLGIVLLLCLLPVGRPSIEIQMEFINQSTLRTMVEATSSLTLHWPIGKQEILSLGEITPAGGWNTSARSFDVELISRNGSPAKTSFDVYFPIEEGKEHVFPLPTCDSQLEIRSFHVLLPGGWTTDSQNVVKRLDPGSKRVMLIWEDMVNPPGARLFHPGSRTGLWARTMLLCIPFLLVLSGLLVLLQLFKKLGRKDRAHSHE